MTLEFEIYYKYLKEGIMKKIIVFITLLFSTQIMAETELSSNLNQLLEEINQKVELAKQDETINSSIDWKKFNETLEENKEDTIGLQSVLKELNIALGNSTGTVCVC